MKRGALADHPIVLSTKRSCLDSSVPNAVSPLIPVLEQYGLLASVVSNLRPDDIIALARASKGLYQIIAGCPRLLDTLLTKACCSGKGTQLRRDKHKNSAFFFADNYKEYVRCGAEEIRRAVETRPCANCKLATCNECRIHCVYQSFWQEQEDIDDTPEIPLYSGFVLLEPSEQPILSPQRLPRLLTTEDRQNLPYWQDPSVAGPYHDQGFLDVALEDSILVTPEWIPDILDLNLGSKSTEAYNWSPVFRSFWRIADARMVFVCSWCVQQPKKTTVASILRRPAASFPWLGESANESIGKCHCTLRSRFLDRWLCTMCYENEDTVISECTQRSRVRGTDVCRCGAHGTYAVCLWCWGEIERPDPWQPSDDVSDD